MNQPIVLITGASSGIGKAAAELLMQKGAKVYGASRRGGEHLTDQNSKGEIISISVDINDEEQMKAAVKRIVDENGRLDVLVSNAGNGIAGAVEDCNSDEVKYQFETCYFGTVKTIQACLPYFRQQKSGKIISISSVAGVIPIPYQAFYSSVKAALLIFMDALAIELKPFGIQCATVLPGDTKTGFTAARKFSIASQNENSPYYQRMKKSVGRMEKDEQNGVSPSFVGKIIAKQAYSRKMHTFYVTGLSYQLICHLYHVLPTRFRIWFISKIYG